MRRFHFKLEAVRKLKEQREQDALREMAAAQRALQAEKDRKKNLLSTLHESFERREKFGKIAMTSTVIQIEENFIVGIKQGLVACDGAILRATRAVEKTMAHYLACRQQRRMMDELRDRAFEKFKDESRKREAKQADDLNIMWARIDKGAA